jgi:hypothetical protein
MKLKNLIGLLLVLGGLYVGYLGYDQISESDASVDVLGLDIDISDEAGKQQGYILLGCGVLIFIGGVYTLNRK